MAAATCMPSQALFLDEMIDNDAELIALISNDDDIFYLISLRRNHKDPRYTDLQLDLQFRRHFHVSAGQQQNNYVYCWVIALRFGVNSTILPVDRQFNFENNSLWSETVSFCVLRSLK